MLLSLKLCKSGDQTVLELITTDLVKHYFDEKLFKVKSQLDEFTKTKIEAELKELETLLKEVEQEKKPVQKTNLLKKARAQVQGIIEQNSKNPFAHLLKSSILGQLSLFEADPEVKKNYIKSTIDSLDQALNYLNSSPQFIWLYKAFLESKFGNTNKSKKNLEYIISQSLSFDWREYITHFPALIDEYVLPYSKGSPLRELLRIRIILLIEKYLRVKKDDKKKISQLLKHDIFEMMKRYDVTSLVFPNNLTSEHYVETFLNSSAGHQNNPLVLKNRIHVILEFLAQGEVYGDIKLEEKYNQLLKENYIAFLKCDSKLKLKLSNEDEELLSILLDGEKDPQLIVEKFRLKVKISDDYADLKPEIVKTLVQFSRHITNPQEKPDTVNDYKKAIVDLEILRIKMEDDELNVQWNNLRITCIAEEQELALGVDELKKLRDKIKQLLNKVELVEKKIKDFNLQTPKSNWLKKTKSYFEEQLQIISYYLQQNEPLTASSLDFINFYIRFQKKVYKFNGEEFKLNSEHFPLIALHKQAHDLFDSSSELASRALNEALEKDPRYCYSYIRLAKLFQDAGKVEEALALCERVIKIYPFKDAFYCLSKLLEKKGATQLANENMLWGICLDRVSEFYTPAMLENDFFRSLENVEVITKADIIKSHGDSYLHFIRHANEALRNKHYFSAFKFYSIAIWIYEPKDNLPDIILHRLICLSLIAKGDAVECFVMQKDLKILSKHKIDEYEFIVITIATNLLRSNNENSTNFAKQILNEISDKCSTAQQMLDRLHSLPKPRALPQPDGGAAAVRSEEIPKKEEKKSTERVFQTDEASTSTYKQDRLKQKAAEERAKAQALKEKLRAESFQIESVKRADALANARVVSDNRREKQKRKKAKAKERQREAPKSSKSDRILEPRRTESPEELGAAAKVPNEIKDVAPELAAASLQAQNPPAKRELASEEFVVEWPLNVIRKINYIIKKLGKDKAFVTGGFVEKIVFGKEYSRKRDIDVVTSRLFDELLVEFPEFKPSGNSKRTLICKEESDLNIPRVELFCRRFLGLDLKLRNYVSKTLRITNLQVVGRHLTDVAPDPDDRATMVKVIVTVTGFPEAFQSIRERILRLPPDISELSSFTTDATRILQGITACCKDSYSDEELNFKKYVYLLDKIASDPEHEKLGSLKKTVEEAFYSGYLVPILKRWIELDITPILFKGLQNEIVNILPILEKTLAEHDAINQDSFAVPQKTPSLLLIIASAIYYKNRGMLDAESLSKVVTEYLTSNIVFNDFIRNPEIINKLICGEGDAKPKKAGITTIYDLLKENFKEQFKDMGEEKSPPQDWMYYSQQQQAYYSVGGAAATVNVAAANYSMFTAQGVMNPFQEVLAWQQRLWAGGVLLRMQPQMQLMQPAPAAAAAAPAAAAARFYAGAAAAPVHHPQDVLVGDDGKLVRVRDPNPSLRTGLEYRRK